jgi:hypothetical protein
VREVDPSKQAGMKEKIQKRERKRKENEAEKKKQQQQKTNH